MPLPVIACMKFGHVVLHGVRFTYGSPRGCPPTMTVMSSEIEKAEKAGLRFIDQYSLARDLFPGDNDQVRRLYPFARARVIDSVLVWSDRCRRLYFIPNEERLHAAVAVQRLGGNLRKFVEVAQGVQSGAVSKQVGGRVL